MKTEKFRKSERIVGQKAVDELFAGTGSHSMAAFPIRVVYIIKERARADEPPLQLLVSVPKRRFRHAVDRNRVKRQLREAFRRHRQQLSVAVPATQSIKMAFIWLSSQHSPSADVDLRVRSLLTRIAQQL